MRGPPLLEGSSSNRSSRDSTVGLQAAARQVTGDDREARRRAVNEHVGCRDLRGLLQVGGGRGRGDIEGGLLGETGRLPKAAERPTSPMEAEKNQVGVVGAAA